MRTDKEKAIKLRLEGKSYTEIQKELFGISKGTLSVWLANVDLTQNIKRRLLARTNKNALKALIARNKNQTKLALARKNDIINNSKKEIVALSRDALFSIGLALYWAEGYKRKIIYKGKEKTYHPISLTNSDPKLVKMFLRFLKEICSVPIEKIKANIRIFQHLNEGVVLSFWSQELGIPRKNFTKTYVGISKSSMGKKPFNRLPYGVIQIRISDTNLFHKIIGWIEGLKNQS